ncbi:hypothetical protein K9857_21760 [Pseudomonas sp. REP124]|uniref:hypothetical protein n=1 Tax=Pseudomonas sp. REP124 TaxID=2875731 RepID=UPI001CCB6A45|nr:hypothetical protein [Pseudomonas sp. REP124]MBZ9784167.1 hypothetical protein [Pseudomonas sp. REP124]
MDFLGLNKDQWEIINGFANWLAAFGTIAAVCLSLKLARDANRVKAKCSAGTRIIVSTGRQRLHEEVLQLKVVNMGDRPFTVTQLGWTVGLRKKTHFAQLFSTEDSDPLPLQLHHGGQGHWYIPAELDEGWYARFGTLLLREGEPWLRTLRLVVTTSTELTFTCKPDAKLLGKLAEAITKLKSETQAGTNPAV